MSIKSDFDLMNDEYERHIHEQVKDILNPLRTKDNYETIPIRYTFDPTQYDKVEIIQDILKLFKITNFPKDCYVLTEDELIIKVNTKSIQHMIDSAISSFI